MLLLLPVVVLLVAAALLLGGGLSRRVPVVLVPMAAGGGLVVIALLATVVVGGAGGPAARAPRARPVPAPTLPDRLSEADVPPLPVVAIDASAGDRGGVAPAVDGLEPAGAVEVRAIGFHSSERGRVELCAAQVASAPSCAARFPVLFDEDGAAAFQYVLRTSAVVGGCGAGRATCLVRVTDDTGRSGTSQVVAGDRQNGPEVQVAPATGLREGTVVAVSVRPVAPGTPVVAVLCAAPGVGDLSGCGAPGTPSRAGGSGEAASTVTVDRSTPCGPGRGCAVVVLSGDGFVAAPPVPVSFSLGAGPRYRSGRVAGGLLVGLAALAGAAVLRRRTDWRQPSEAATPEMDATDLQTEAPLDELFGTDAELEAERSGAIP